MASAITQNRLTGRASAVLFVLCGAIFMEGIDVSMMGVALLVYAGTAAGGFSLGMVAGGLVTAIDWRWAFCATVLSSGPISARYYWSAPSSAPSSSRCSICRNYGPGRNSRPASR